jgi:hypothetical protein
VRALATSTWEQLRQTGIRSTIITTFSNPRLEIVAFGDVWSGPPA